MYIIFTMKQNEMEKSFTLYLIARNILCGYYENYIYSVCLFFYFYLKGCKKNVVV